MDFFFFLLICSPQMTAHKNKLYNIFENPKEPWSRYFWLAKKAVLIFKNLASLSQFFPKGKNQLILER